MPAVAGYIGFQASYHGPFSANGSIYLLLVDPANDQNLIALKGDGSTFTPVGGTLSFVSSILAVSMDEYNGVVHIGVSCTNNFTYHSSFIFSSDTWGQINLINDYALDMSSQAVDLKVRLSDGLLIAVFQGTGYRTMGTSYNQVYYSCSADGGVTWLAAKVIFPDMIVERNFSGAQLVQSKSSGQAYDNYMYAACYATSSSRVNHRSIANDGDGTILPSLGTQREISDVFLPNLMSYAVRPGASRVDDNKFSTRDSSPGGVVGIDIVEGTDPPAGIGDVISADTARYRNNTPAQCYAIDTNSVVYCVYGKLAGGLFMKSQEIKSGAWSDEVEIVRGGDYFKVSCNVYENVLGILAEENAIGTEYIAYALVAPVNHVDLKSSIKAYVEIAANLDIVVPKNPNPYAEFYELYPERYGKNRPGPKVLNYYHWRVMLPTSQVRADYLFNVWGPQVNNTVAIIGGVYGWTIEELNRLSKLKEKVCFEVSDWVRDTWNISEEEELRQSIMAAGEDPDTLEFIIDEQGNTGNALQYMLRPDNPLRTTCEIIIADISDQNPTYQNAYDRLISEDVFPTQTREQVKSILHGMHFSNKLRYPCYHVVTTLVNDSPQDPQFRWQSLEAWYAEIAEEYPGDIVLDATTGNWITEGASGGPNDPFEPDKA